MTKELEKKEQKEVTSTSAEQLIDLKNAYKPDVDIYNNQDGLIMVMDLPGVRKGDVSIEIDENNTLIVRGKSSFREPENRVYKQFGLGNYYRAFTISNEFDKDRVSALIENGVLELTIPRREAVKPKRVEITV